MASNAREALLPEKSKTLYENVYKDYHSWCVQEKIEKTTEESIMTYFKNELNSYKSSSLWTKYSMLRSTINLNEGVDIGKFYRLISYLKKKGEGHEPKKSFTLSKENIDNFLLQASDKEHLLNKVILIFGVTGACRRQELVSLKTTSIEDYDSYFLVKLVDASTKTHRSFIIVPGNLENINLLDIIRKYSALRSPNTPHNRFFVNYLNEKCTVQPVGVHKIAGVPSVVAKFLKLENPGAYTSHCFRRTSASILAGMGANVDIKKLGGWCSSTVVEAERKRLRRWYPNDNYVDESENSKMSAEVAAETDAEVGQPEEKAGVSIKNLENTTRDVVTQQSTSSGINIFNNKDCVININLYYNSDCD